MMTETEWVVIICTLAIISFICIAVRIIESAIDDLWRELLWFMSKKGGEQDNNI